MKNFLFGVVLMAATASAVAQPAAQAVFTQGELAFVGAALGGVPGDGDAGAIASDSSTTPTRIFVFNGGDTDDGDGDGVFSYTAGSTSSIVLGPSGNVIEAAIAAVGGSTTNSPYRGMAASGGTAYVVIDPNGDSAAYLVRINGTTAEVIAGGNSGTSVVDGTADIAVIGTNVYLLQRAAISAAADQVLVLNGAAPAGITQTGTAISLASAFGVTQSPSAIEATPAGNLLILDSGATGVSDSIGQITLSTPTAGTFTILKSGASIVADLTGSGITDMGYQAGNLAIDPRTNDIYLLADKDFVTPIQAGDFVVRLAASTGYTASIYITGAQAAAAIPSLMGPDGAGNPATGLFFNIPFSIVVKNEGSASNNHLHITNDNSGGDGVLRVALPGTSAVADWTLY